MLPENVNFYFGRAACKPLYTLRRGQLHSYFPGCLLDSGIFHNITDHKQVILLYERYDRRHRMTRSNLNQFLPQQSAREKSHAMKRPFRKGYCQTKSTSEHAVTIVWSVPLSDPKSGAKAWKKNLLLDPVAPISICFKLDGCLTKAKNHLNSSCSLFKATMCAIENFGFWCPPVEVQKTTTTKKSHWLSAKPRPSQLLLLRRSSIHALMFHAVCFTFTKEKDLKMRNYQWVWQM